MGINSTNILINLASRAATEKMVTGISRVWDKRECGAGPVVNLTGLNNIISLNIASVNHLLNILLITGDSLQVPWIYPNGLGR